jgi:hypothetical protein
MSGNIIESTSKLPTSQEAYTRRTVPTVIISFIVSCSACFFVWAAFNWAPLILFILGLVIKGYRAKVIEYLLFIFLFIVPISYFVKLRTFARVVESPHFLFQERRQLYRSLIPPAISLLCIFGWRIFSYLLGSAIVFDIPRVMEWIVYLDFLLSTLALIAMLRPRSDNILARCFVPFIENEPKSITA